MRAFLARLGAASPLVPALLYAAAALLANLVATFAPGNVPLLALALLLWLFVGLGFFAVVVWFRDDDWLAAGFLLTITLVLSGWTANVVAATLQQGSLAPVLIAAPGLFLGTLVRAVIGVPVLGGLAAGLRWMSAGFRPAESRQPARRRPH